MLADGVKFKFQSAQESPYFDSERDNELFRLQSGSDLHRSYAFNQIQNKILIANQSPNRLERNSIELFRKAKNDLEEGGFEYAFSSAWLFEMEREPRRYKKL